MRPAAVVCLCGFSLLLLSLSFAPSRHGYLAYVALVPFLWALFRVPRRHVFALSFLFGLAFWLVEVYWLAYCTVAGYLTLCAFLPVYMALFGIGARRLRQRFPRGWIVAVPLLWTSLELVRSNVWSIAFPTFLMGHTQWSFLAMIQIADIGGVYLLSAIVVYGNAVVVALLETLGKDPPRPIERRQCLIHAAAFALVVILSLSYGAWRMRSIPLAPGPLIASVQGNIPQEVKESRVETERIVETHVQLTLEALAQSPQTPDLIVWPETMIPVAFTAPSAADERKLLLDRLAPGAGTSMLVGSVFVTPAPNVGERLTDFAAFNSAFLIDPSGEIVARYDKMRPILFSEKLPFKRVLPFLRRVVPSNFGYIDAGRDQTLFPLANFRFSVLICYEDMMPDLARSAARRGADILINMTNDAWFKESGELPYHMSTSVFRAVEHRVPVFRAANTGISASIDPLGRVRRIPPHAPDVLFDRIKTCDATTCYQRTGDLPWWVLAVAVLAATIARRTQQP